MKGDRVKEVTMEITVGAFIFMVLLALGIFTIAVSQRNFFKETYTYEVTFPDVSGLRDGENVYSRGLKVGTVKQMEFLEKGAGVRVTLELDKPVSLRDDYQVKVADSSLLGGKQVQIDEGTSDRPLLDDQQLTTLIGVQPNDIMRDASETVAYLRDTLERTRVFENIERLTDELSITAQALNQGTGTVARLLHDDTLIRDLESSVANFETITVGIRNGEGLAGQLLASESDMSRQVSGTLKNIESISARVDNLSARLERGEGLAGQLLSAESQVAKDFQQMMEKLNRSVAAIERVATKIDRGEGLIGKLLSDDDAFYNDLRTTTANLAQASASIRNISVQVESGQGSLGKFVRDDTLYNNVLQTSESLQQLSQKATSGEGSLGKLINDPELYNEASSLVKEARATVDDLRETSPITTFSSIFFGAF